MILRRRYAFEASHTLPRHPGKCRRLHGHSYRFIVELTGPIDPEQGLVIDFDELDRIVAGAVIAPLDHRHLNDIIDNPTAEHIAIWIYRALAPAVPGLTSIELFEIEGASVVYRGEEEGGA